MGSGYAILGYPDTPRDGAAGALASCERALRDAGWIEGEADPEATYGTRWPSFRPGPAASDRVKFVETRQGRVPLSVNGVAFCGPGYFNHGPFVITPDFRCPDCGAEIGHGTPEAREQQERCFALVADFCEARTESRAVACVVCAAEVDLNDLIADGPPTFALCHVAVEFWDWPPDEVAEAAKVTDEAMGQVHRDGWVKV
ncbi:hypothetical protein HKCCE2091_01325 [Rhodobacterales bacterium HKCCE2091]|nr:hypothetical protein [Rhodobacterales bacterium HKCCE2091]